MAAAITTASKDRLGVTILPGDTLLYASTAKSAGVRWSRHKVTRVSGNRFYYAGDAGEFWGKCSNGLVVLPAGKSLVKGAE